MGVKLTSNRLGKERKQKERGEGVSCRTGTTKNERIGEREEREEKGAKKQSGRE